MQRIGLTGGIGSGKSTVAATLVGLGVALIDADANARAATAPGGEAIAAIAAAFGSAYITADGALDRGRMRELAFTEPAAKLRLEAIIHPLVGLRGEQQMAAAHSAGHTCVVFDIPLLVESGRWRQKLDHVVVIDCLEATQIERVMHRSGLTEQAAKAVIAVQATRSERLAAADAVIFNDGITLDDLHHLTAAMAKGFGL